MTFDLEAFRRGVQAGRDLLQGEEHHYTLMIHGIAAAMRAAGREVEPMDVASRWHDPLCGAKAEDLEDPSEMLRVMGFGGNYGFERMVRTEAVDRLFEERYGSDPVNDMHRKLAEAFDEEWIEREAKALFDYEYKVKWPEKRRGTKHYRETWDRISEQARGIKRGERLEAAKSAVAEAERRASRSSYDGDWFSRMRQARSLAEGYGVRIADLEALSVESEWIPKMREIAKVALERADRSERHVREAIAEAKVKLGMETTSCSP